MELDDARTEGEERVVAADADARPRAEAGAALADDIIPALTSWPAKIFTPSRWLCESRPFLEEPSPFLCAI